MKSNMRYAMIAAFLMVTSLALGNNVTIADGISNGTITASSTTANAAATITLTVTPSDGYYITANDITIIQTAMAVWLRHVQNQILQRRSIL